MTGASGGEGTRKEEESLRRRGRRLGSVWQDHHWPFGVDLAKLFFYFVVPSIIKFLSSSPNGRAQPETVWVMPLDDPPVQPAQGDANVSNALISFDNRDKSAGIQWESGGRGGVV